MLPETSASSSATTAPVSMVMSKPEKTTSSPTDSESDSLCTFAAAEVRAFRTSSRAALATDAGEGAFDQRNLLGTASAFSFARCRIAPDHEHNYVSVCCTATILYCSTKLA